MKVYEAYREVALDAIEVVREGLLLRVNYNFLTEEQTDEMGDETITTKMLTSDEVKVYGSHDYGSIISAIVSEKYSTDDREAIIANYHLAVEGVTNGLTEEKRKEYISEYDTFQAYRVKAKELAKKVISIIEE